MTDGISSDQVEIIVEFVNESRDLIDELEPTIISMEEMVGTASGAPLSSKDTDTLNSIFRLFHSIKGGAGFLGFNNIVKSTHTAETLLDQLRSSEIKLTPTHVDLLCSSCDFAKEALDYVEQNYDDNGVAELSDALIKKFASAASESQTSSPDKTAASSLKPESTAQSQSTPLEINLNISLEDLTTPETRQKFLDESEDIIQEIEEDLLQLASESEDITPVERLFRNVHSFKGNCGFIGFNDLEQILHTEETLLEKVKDGTLKNVGKISDMLLELLDVLKEALTSFAHEGEKAIEGLDIYLEIINNHLPKSVLQDSREDSSTKLGDILVDKGVVNKDDIDEALDTQQKPIGELLVDSGVATEAQIEKALETQKKLRPQETGKPQAKAGPKRQDIRVDLDKLDNLINLIGEMVIAENMVIHNPDLEGLELENFSKAAQHMGKIIRELQEMAMVIRMIPISGLFRRMIRLVHDLSRKSGKKVELKLAGEGTEVDKTVIEKITDPLIHLIRNSMDHGIEDSESRKIANKPQTGSLHLSASHEEGEVLITLTDDGRGMDRDKLIAKGIERGIVEGDGSQLSDQEALQLIFQPGFSTAEEITDISGRGVGMDVVRQNLESIKGRIDVSSSPGEGTQITLRIPLTLAIIDGMLIRTGSAYYILPVLSIRESFQTTADKITLAPDGQELVKVRENLFPVVRLHELHKITPDHQKLEDGILIVLESKTRKNICLFVDELMGQQQTVIKGMADYIGKLGDVGGVSGCTILGNGEVCLILDVRALEEIANSDE